MPAPESPPAQALSGRSGGDASLAAELTAVALGGAIGACLRAAVALVFGSVAPMPPLIGTAVANLSGAVGLGWLFGHWEQHLPHPLTRPFLAVGVLGSYTTYSTLVLENAELFADRGGLMAGIHLVSSIASGLIGFAAGQRIGRGEPLGSGR